MDAAVAAVLSMEDCRSSTRQRRVFNACGKPLGTELINPSYYFTENRRCEHQRRLGLPKGLLPHVETHEFACITDLPLEENMNKLVPDALLPNLKGTVGMSALDVHGCIATVTSTGGWTNKLVRHQQPDEHRPRAAADLTEAAAAKLHQRKSCKVLTRDMPVPSYRTDNLHVTPVDPAFLPPLYEPVSADKIDVTVAMGSISALSMFSSTELAHMITVGGLSHLNQFPAFFAVYVCATHRGDMKVLALLKTLDKILYSGQPMPLEDEGWAYVQDLTLRNLFGSTKCGAMLLSVRSNRRPTPVLHLIAGTHYSPTPPPPFSSCSRPRVALPLRRRLLPLCYAHAHRDPLGRRTHARLCLLKPIRCRVLSPWHIPDHPWPVDLPCDIAPQA
ncbi:uncharacterized protein BXZ73DRAFT_111355 [Epithele typhae]|uniref:uncharacterized protein n=1 Tax=Epithele typhae TaxID=378194 RepID=UPI002008AA41|nr:uncharacterized protein BXZ73DRAFT_111355 [Epithele typhae]KAH9903893.1 hypothetical protein BXZ73DRAFT_111355 [Epithele typhae]